MMDELLTPAEMSEADRLAIAGGPSNGYGLMCRAGAAIAAAILARYPASRHFHVLCGPGNNGGDGLVVARLLADAGCPVTAYQDDSPRPGTDAAMALAALELRTRPLEVFYAGGDDLVVDAMFGAGLTRPLQGNFARAVERANASGAAVLAVDLPSGLSGDSGQVLGGIAIRADMTVTFFRRKPGHLLLPGRSLCGETVVADIGIADEALTTIGPKLWQNNPRLWQMHLPRPTENGHKYSRGHVASFSGGPSATGAARLAAMAAARAGAGAVTVVSPGSAMSVNAAHLTAIMLRRADRVDELADFVNSRKVAGAVIGPGFGVGEHCRNFVSALNRLRGEEVLGLVLDADALTSFEEEPEALFALLAKGTSSVQPAVLTPHEGEFGRLFPDLAGAMRSKVERAREAASRCTSVVILKGPDTVVASPDDRAVINAHASPYLATAGSGDVLAGLVAGFLAQGMPSFEAACAAVWIHGDCSLRFGPGLTADDLPGLIPTTLRQLVGT
ncbi:NAD(P)H-hydrate dehydratase [Nitratireductor mangrovi]|uniref:Bifunctional NAD(P)H-hydrate repair enzyme n=2 Tax=Nitratireductor mangrovi TaxID=2599600 RepID=A0A5B8KVG0_9HYPH|nr:NAD(P)H-hydrate dehydratase [Nitratireductor mangrovi]QDY99646.1 NAD(P)H-hydrate dehydratase [Nitratireductor mangrovi]